MLWVTAITKVICIATLSSAEDVEELFLVFYIWASCCSWHLLSPTQTPYLLQPQWLSLLWEEESIGLGTHCCHIPGENLPALHLGLDEGTSRGWSRWWCWCALSGLAFYLGMKKLGECLIHHPLVVPQPLPNGSIILRTKATSFASWEHSADAKLAKIWIKLKLKKMYLTTI